MELIHMCSAMLIIYISCFGLSQAEHVLSGEKPDWHDKLNLKVFRPNFGVSFISESVIDNSNSYWVHDFKISRLPTVTPPPKFNVCGLSKIKNSDNYTHNVKQKELIKDICQQYETLLPAYHKQSEILYFDIQADLRAIDALMLKQMPINRRMKRAPFEIVGSALHALFGVATGNDIKDFVERADRLEHVTQQLGFQYDDLSDNLLSYIHIAEEKYSTLSHKVLINYNNTLTLQKHVDNLFESILDARKQTRLTTLLHATVIHNFLTATTQQIQTLQLIKDLTTDRLSAVELLTQNTLSPKLITPNELRELFNVISGILAQKYPNFQISNNDPNFLYHLPNVYHYSTGNYLYVRIKIPLTSYNSIFRVYKTHQIPLPIPNGNASEATTIDNVGQYIGISDDSKFYIELSSEFYGKCQGDSVKYCADSLPVMDRNTLTCTAAIFLNEAKMAHEKCRVTYLRQQDPLNLVQSVGNGQYLVITDSSDEWYLACGRDAPYRITTPSFGIITLPCNCALRTTNLYIPASLTLCNDSSQSTIYHEHLVNLLYLYAWYNHTQIESLDGATKFADLLDIKHVPHIDIQRLDQSDVVKADNKLSVDLATLVKTVRKGHIPYYSSADKQGLSRPSTNYWHIITKCLSIAGFGVTMIVIFAVLYLYCKTKPLGKLIMGVTGLPVTKAFPNNGVPDVFHPVLSSTKESADVSHCSYMLIPSMYLYIAASLLSCFLLYHIAKFVYHVCSNPITWTHPLSFFQWHGSMIKTEILLELTDINKYVVLKLLEIEGPPQNYSFQDAKITFVNYVQTTCLTYLRVSWHQTKLLRNNENCCSLPDIIKVPLGLGNICRSVTVSPDLTANLLIGIRGLYTRVSINEPCHTDDDTSDD